MDSKYAVVVVVLLGLTLMSGCTSPGGESGGQGGADISFSEDETNGVGVQVSSMGSYDAVWVEVENLEGGFQIGDEREVPALYISDTGAITVGDVCFKESHDSECTEGPLASERREELQRDSEIRVYGLSGGEKTVIETREP